MPWRRRPTSAEPPLSREDVVAIFEALADLKAWTNEIFGSSDGSTMKPVRRMNPDEWAAFQAEAQESIRKLRERAAKKRAELEAERRVAEKPRRLRRLFRS